MPEYYIGIDWGKSKCGIALADKENKIAAGYKIVSNKDFFDEIKKINKENPIKKIIIGSLARGENIGEIKVVKSKLEGDEFTVELENEDFSSILAQSNLKEAGLENISKYDDAEAARIILQSWLDKKGK